MQSSANHALDALTIPLHDWRNLTGSRAVPVWFKHAVRLGHGSFLGRRLLQQLVAFLCESTTLALAFTQVSCRHSGLHLAAAAAAA